MIRIETDLFKPLREQINFMIDTALRDMIETDVETENVTAKIKITMSKRAVPYTETESRLARIPEFTFKVSNSKQIKREVEGEIYEDQMEIITDETGELRYKRIDTGQMSLFDAEGIEE